MLTTEKMMTHHIDEKIHHKKSKFQEIIETLTWKLLTDQMNQNTLFDVNTIDEEFIFQRIYYNIFENLLMSY